MVEKIILVLIVVIFAVMYRKKLPSLFGKREVLDVLKTREGDSYYRCYFSDGGSKITRRTSSKWYKISEGDQVVKIRFLFILKIYKPLPKQK